MLTAALLIGGGQGAFGPATLSLVAGATPVQHLGLAFGSIGAIRNAGKIAGPIVAGALVSTMSYQASFASIAAIPLMIALWILCLSGTSLAIPASEAMRVQRVKAPRSGR